VEFNFDFGYLRSNTKVVDLMDVTCTNCDTATIVAKLDELITVITYMQTISTILLELICFVTGLILLSTIMQVVVIWARRF
jgi:hypothetical protein